MRKRRGSRPSRLVALIAGAVVVAVMVLALRHYLAPPPISTARGPSIGGPINLVDQDGKPVTADTFRGHFTLVYFGYTFCPDICPTSLTTMADAIDLLGADGKKVIPVFITVDPERDTPAQLKMYVSHFSPRMVGLTGTPAQIKAAAKAYRVYYAKVQEKGAAPDDYAMDHTSIIYLMGPDGKFRAHFSYDTGADAIAKRIREFL